MLAKIREFLAVRSVKVGISKTPIFKIFERKYVPTESNAKNLSNSPTSSRIHLTHSKLLPNTFLSIQTLLIYVNLFCGYLLNTSYVWFYQFISYREPKNGIFEVRVRVCVCRSWKINILLNMWRIFGKVLERWENGGGFLDHVGQFDPNCCWSIFCVDMWVFVRQVFKRTFRGWAQVGLFWSRHMYVLYANPVFFIQFV